MYWLKQALVHTFFKKVFLYKTIWQQKNLRNLNFIDASRHLDQKCLTNFIFSFFFIRGISCQVSLIEFFCDDCFRKKAPSQKLGRFLNTLLFIAHLGLVSIDWKWKCFSLVEQTETVTARNLVYFNFFSSFQKCY